MSVPGYLRPIADICAMSVSPPTSDVLLSRSKRRSGAMCGRLPVGKDFLHECSVGRCSHVFGLQVRFT